MNETWSLLIFYYSYVPVENVNNKLLIVKKTKTNSVYYEAGLTLIKSQFVRQTVI